MPPSADETILFQLIFGPYRFVVPLRIPDHIATPNPHRSTSGPGAPTSGGDPGIRRLKLSSVPKASALMNLRIPGCDIISPPGPRGASSKVSGLRFCLRTSFEGPELTLLDQ